MNESDEDMRTRLMAETGELPWQALEKHFARGVVIRLSPDLDLLHVAYCFTKDDAPTIKTWMNHGALAPASVEEARRWHNESTRLMAVVTAPWVLVQEINAPA